MFLYRKRNNPKLKHIEEEVGGGTTFSYALSRKPEVGGQFSKGGHGGEQDEIID